MDSICTGIGEGAFPFWGFASSPDELAIEGDYWLPVLRVLFIKKKYMLIQTMSFYATLFSTIHFLNLLLLSILTVEFFFEENYKLNHTYLIKCLK